MIYIYEEGCGCVMSNELVVGFMKAKVFVFSFWLPLKFVLLYIDYYSYLSSLISLALFFFFFFCNSIVSF